MEKKKKLNMKVQWLKFICVLVLYLLSYEVCHVVGGCVGVRLGGCLFH